MLGVLPQRLTCGPISIISHLYLVVTMCLTKVGAYHIPGAHSPTNLSYATNPPKMGRTRQKLQERLDAAIDNPSMLSLLTRQWALV